MGQAAGTAAALSLDDDKELRDLDVSSLQKTLREGGALIDLPSS
jgi:hypothetical protein